MFSNFHMYLVQPPKVRYLKQYEADHPESEVKLQANDEVQNQREVIKAAGRKAVIKFQKDFPDLVEANQAN